MRNAKKAFWGPVRYPLSGTVSGKVYGICGVSRQKVKNSQMYSLVRVWCVALEYRKLETFRYGIRYGQNQGVRYGISYRSGTE